MVWKGRGGERPACGTTKWHNRVSFKKSHSHLERIRDIQTKVKTKDAGKLMIPTKKRIHQKESKKHFGGKHSSWDDLKRRRKIETIPKRKCFIRKRSLFFEGGYP